MRSGLKANGLACHAKAGNGRGMSYRLKFAEQLLLCLIYYRTYTSHAFMGLLFNVSSPTVWRRTRAMSELMAGYFQMPERKIKLSACEKDDLLYLMVDGTERPFTLRIKSAPEKALATQGEIFGQEKAPHRLTSDHHRQ